MSPLNEKSAPVDAAGHRARERDRPRIAGLREPIDHDAARIAEPEQLGALVERLAGGVVARRAELDDVGRAPSTRTSEVWPPETISARCGIGGGSGSR